MPQLVKPVKLMQPDGEGVAPTGPPPADRILLETGDFLLLETADKALIDNL